MTYTRPHIVSVGSALSAIQSNEKGFEQDQDAIFPHPNNATLSAYEADE